MATVGSAIVCDRLRLYGNRSLCDRLRSTIRDRLRSFAIIWKPALTSSDPSVNKSSTFNLESMLSFICCASSVVVGKCKDFREGFLFFILFFYFIFYFIFFFCEAGELTRTFLRQGLLPGGVSSNLFDGLVVCS